MSFNEIAVFRTALGAISREHPKLINAGKRSLLWVIVSYPDGCFIGKEELADQAGIAEDTVFGYLRELTKLGFISREQTYARKGVRQCYRVNVRNLEHFVSLLPVTPSDNDTQPNPLLPVTEESKPVTESANAYHPEHPYKDYKDYKYDKDKDRLSTETKSALKVKAERWHVISQGLDDYVKRKWTHSVESEKLLDVIESLPGWSLQRLQDDLSALEFGNSYNNCGLLMRHLRDLAGVVSAPKTVPKETPTISNNVINALGGDVFALPKDL
jgi:DNA-binding CsgD family transcriptional regulator